MWRTRDRRVLGYAGVVVILSLVLAIFFAQRFAAAGRVPWGLARFRALLKTADLGPSRPVYPYSVVPGGVHSADEAKSAVSQDRVVAEHYAGVSMPRLRPVNLQSERRAYVSFRVKNGVFWTKRPVTLPQGEKILSDGEALIRARCGNRISEFPRVPVLAEEPPELAADEVEPPVIEGSVSASPPVPQSQPIEGLLQPTSPSDQFALSLGSLLAGGPSGSDPAYVPPSGAIGGLMPTEPAPSTKDFWDVTPLPTDEKTDNSPDPVHTPPGGGVTPPPAPAVDPPPSENVSPPPDGHTPPPPGEKVSPPPAGTLPPPPGGTATPPSPGAETPPSGGAGTPPSGGKITPGGPAPTDPDPPPSVPITPPPAPEPSSLILLATALLASVSLIRLAGKKSRF